MWGDMWKKLLRIVRLLFERRKDLSPMPCKLHFVMKFPSSLFAGAFSAALLVSMAHGASAAESLEPAEPVDALMEKSKPLEQKFKAKEALTYLLAAEKQAPTNPRLLVRIARQYRYLMTDAPGIEEKLRWGHTA